MKVRATHEVYISLKQFETIGFHNEGRYNLSAAFIASNTDHCRRGYPNILKSTNNQSMMSERERSCYIDEDNAEFHSPPFDVQFNEQSFNFQDSCIFKLEVDAEKEYNIELALVIKLNKFKVQDDLQADKGVSDRSECMILEEKNAKQTVSQSKVFINRSTDIQVHPFSAFRKVFFSNYQYYSALSLTISHSKLGYMIRPLPHDMAQFARSKQIRLNVLHREPTHISKNQIICLLKKTFNNTMHMYERLVKELISHDKRLEAEEKCLGKAEEQCLGKAFVEKESEKREGFRIEMEPKPTFFNKMKKTKQRSWIELEEGIGFEEEIEIYEFYECLSEDELCLQLFREAINLGRCLLGRWVSCIGFYEQKSFEQVFSHLHNTNLKYEVEYLKKNRYAPTLQASKNYEPLIPKLKYYSEKHLLIPYMFEAKDKHGEPKDQTDIDQYDPQNTLFILVHGFNGNEFDMNKIKSYLGFFRATHFLILRNIGTKISDSLEELGQIAAQQIIDFLSNKHFITRINFIGFSLGGVIIRACLPFIKDHHHMLNLLITLSSPHLGINQINSCMVRTGVAFLQRIKGVKNLKEMSVESSKKDRKIYEEQLSFFQRLASDGFISAFNTVILYGSEEDKYVPGYSSLLQYEGENRRIRQMQKQLIKKMRALKVISVTFSEEKRGTYWERASGRRIHINFLDDESFLYLILCQHIEHF